MANEAQMTKHAREHAEKLMGKAQAELVEAAKAIANKYRLPDGINGLSGAEFLGRLSFVVSLSRDLRAAGAAELTKEHIKAVFADKATPPGVELDDKREETTTPSPAADITELKINPMTVKALKGAGIHTVEEVEKYTDEALLAINGIAPPSLAKLRAAVQSYPLGAGSD